MGPNFKHVDFGHQNINIIKIRTLDPPLDFISVVNNYTLKCPSPLPMPVWTLLGVGAEGRSCGFKQDTAAPHQGKNLGKPT